MAKRAPNVIGEEIYRVARSFAEGCLGAQESLFSPGARVWTDENAAELDATVAVDDTVGEGTFVDKLVRQVDGLDDGAVQLAAEMLFMLLVTEFDIKGGTSREHVRRVLDVMERPPSIPQEVDAALDAGGVAKFGAGKRQRPAFIRFYLELAKDFAALEPDRRQALLASPWEFLVAVSGLRTSRNAMAVNALLHLLFPETFEYAITPGDQERLIAAFSRAPGVAGVDGTERRIAKIRELISDDVDLYRDRAFKRSWQEHATPGWEEVVRWAIRLFEEQDFDERERDYKLDLAARVESARTALLAGSDDWGEKLRNAFIATANNLTSWQAHDTFLKWCEQERESARQALQVLWTDADDAFRLADFLDALPHATISGSGTRLSLASYLMLGVDPARYPFFRITVLRGFEKVLHVSDGADGGSASEELTEAAPYFRWIDLLEELRWRMLGAGVQIRDLLDAQGIAWWLVQAPAPESWSPEDTEAFEAFREGREPRPGPEPEPPEPPSGAPVLPAVPSEFAENLHLPQRWLQQVVDLLATKSQLILYGPPGTGKTFVARALGKHLAQHGGEARVVQFHPAYTYEDFFEGYRPHQADNGELTYRLTPGSLRQLAQNAAERPGLPHLLIIDEINRGNIAKIFGELYYLLEYRDEEIRLQYSSDEQFRLPRNLYFIGTMNTADRSIALVDSALRRRFAFVGMLPTREPVAHVLDNWLRANELDPEPAELLRALNREIADEDFSIGPSYFMREDGSLDQIWRHEIIPLLAERYYGSDRDVEQEFSLTALRRRIAAEADAQAPETDEPDSAGG